MPGDTSVVPDGETDDIDLEEPFNPYSNERQYRNLCACVSYILNL
jgi:hypothetical protein